MEFLPLRIPDIKHNGAMRYYKMCNIKKELEEMTRRLMENITRIIAWTRLHLPGTMYIGALSPIPKMRSDRRTTVFLLNMLGLCGRIFRVPASMYVQS